MVGSLPFPTLTFLVSNALLMGKILCHPPAPSNHDQIMKIYHVLRTQAINEQKNNWGNNNTFSQ